jgi:hypothetical protein
MPGFKQTLIVTQAGTTAESQLVVLSIDLTPEQSAEIRRHTGQCPAKLELSAHDLKVILLPNVGMKY